MLDAKMLDESGSSLMVALRVRQSDADLCAERLEALNRRLTEADGFRSLDVIRRDGGLGTDFFIIARFDTVEALEAWRASPERAERLRDVEALAITDVSRQQMAGSNIWFEPVVSIPSAPTPPPFWKRWLLSFVAVYPALILLVAILSPVTASLPEALRLLVIAIVLTGLTTAFIVPILTRSLSGWLHRG
ncbi:Antibiotic biosynthesis monooxygenase [Roseivivax jejudonensis]|uniref:Antibiotic biosynthesis monooxygenase n=1 Tax=Roseivivax jejudonensis TaxID=1529041 RepID=A0A1X6Y3N8_9RHOB|nr:antibiotic biosynthesis monooxygenase [Roseivivax jejudonensis]SLN09728.1 Antibiotic biosynthesis monooxygenase [Roseivivax jejudonensis]